MDTGAGGANSPERRLLVTDHETFGYFADRYGFRLVERHRPQRDQRAAPSAQEMAALVEQIRETGAPAIFLEAGRSRNWQSRLPPKPARGW